ncbi:MAG: hypothetical protein WBD36_07885 [Bacteroidota bacterium]
MWTEREKLSYGTTTTPFNCLGVIIVGIAVYGGIRLMDACNQGIDRDMLIPQMHAVVSDAKQYAFKPTYLG